MCKGAKWYTTKVREGSIPHEQHMMDDTELLIKQSDTFFNEVKSMGARSVHVGKKKKKQCYARGKPIFKMGCMLMMIASANLVKGMENVKARDVPEPTP